jgi:hypothetical protein
MASLSACLPALLLLAAAAVASAPTLDEDRLRAAFVLRFAQYTQWPSPHEGGQLPLCLAGLRSGEEALLALNQRSVGSAELRVRVVETPADAAALCRVLLLGHADAATLRRWIEGLGNAPVLVLGTSPEALRAGVTIALISEPQGMAFSVNHGEAKRRGLSLAAPVLKLAREVR